MKIYAILGLFFILAVGFNSVAAGDSKDENKDGKKKKDPAGPSPPAMGRWYDVHQQSRSTLNPVWLNHLNLASCFHLSLSLKHWSK